MGRHTAQCMRRALSCNAFASSAEDGRIALVQGASRGLGLEFVRQLLARPGQRCARAIPAWYGALAGVRHRG